MTTVGLAMSVFNGERTIDDALASVAAQTRRPDSVVIVDDGSTDGTATRVMAWTGRLPIRLVRQPNQGVAAGRTAAVAALDTDLVLGLDADDEWMPPHVERLTDLHARYGGIAAPLAVRWRAGHVGGLVAHPDRRIEKVIVMNSIFSGSMFERTAYERAGGRYRFDGCEDWDLWLRLMRDGNPVHILPEPTVRYRISDDSLSADDRGLPRECQVLGAFVNETDDPRLRRIGLTSLRHRHARLSLRESYREAAAGRSWSARRAALGALAGPGNVQAIGAAMVLAPKLALSCREIVRRHR